MIQKNKQVEQAFYDPQMKDEQVKNQQLNTVRVYDAQTLWESYNEKNSKTKVGKILNFIRRVFHRKERQITAYNQIENIRKNPETVQRGLKLHHARGKQLVDKGEHVLEFDMAGSGFEHFNTPQKGLHGEEDWEKWDNDMKEKFENKFGKQDETMGKEHIRRKVTENDKGVEAKTRITMAGPLGLGGVSNSGDYSIENLRKYMLEMASNYLKPLFESWEKGASPRNINLIIKGHSRGAVAAGEGAMMIREWVNEKYSKYLDKVKFELVQYDPVPGFGSYDDHAEIDYAEKKGKDKKKIGLGSSAQTTVFYSMNTQWPAGFTPQKVRHAKRVILTPFKHGIDLDKTDSTGEHRMGYTKAGNPNEVYRSSGISELDEGVYISTEDHQLIKIENAQDAETLIRKYNEIHLTQKDRSKLLIDIVKQWFEDKAERDQNESKKA